MRWLAFLGVVAAGGLLAVEPPTPPGRVVIAEPTLGAAIEAHRQGDDEVAISTLQTWLESGEGPWGRERDAGRFLLGWLLRARGDANLASAQFTRVRAGGGPLEVYAAFYEAEADHRRGRHEVAASECKAYRARWPTGPHASECLMLMGDAYVAAGLRSPAITAYQTYRDENPGTPRDEEIALGVALAEANVNPAKGALRLKQLTLEHDYLCTATQAQSELDALMELHALEDPEVDEMLAAQLRAMSQRDGGFGPEAWKAYQDVLGTWPDESSSWGTGTWERFCWRTHRYDDLGDAFAATYAKTSSADDAWFAFRAYFRGGDFAESAKWGEIGMADHSTHRRWRRSRDVVAHSQQLAGDFVRAREHWDILARTGGSLGRGAEWFAAFSAYRAGEHEDAVKRLDPIVAAGDERKLQALYYRGKALSELGDREGAQADWRRILDGHPTSWYGLLLRSKWRKLPDSTVRDGSWPDVPPAEPPTSVASPPLGTIPTVQFGAGAATPSRDFEWAALHAWGGSDPDGTDSPTLIGGAPLGAFGLEDTYVPGRWHDLPRQEEAFRTFAARNASIWPHLPAAYDLASVGIYEIAGEYVADCYDEYQWASGKRTERQKLVRSVSVKKSDWREIFLFVQDHHHVARFSMGLAPAAPTPEEWTKAMRLAHPAAHRETVTAWSREHDLDPLLALGLMRRESLYRSTALSHAGAVGVMQIMPLTGSRVAYMLATPTYSPADLEVPSTNIRFGTFYLSKLLERFDGNFTQAVAAYNGGPVHVSSWSRSWQGRIDTDDWVEQIPLKETRTYVKGVTENYAVYLQLYGPEGAAVHVPFDLSEVDDPGVIDF